MCGKSRRYGCEGTAQVDITSEAAAQSVELREMGFSSCRSWGKVHRQHVYATNGSLTCVVRRLSKLARYGGLCGIDMLSVGFWF
jgi:hypothetical protein